MKDYRYILIACALRHNATPEYQGVTMGRTLSLKLDLNNTSVKVRTRNNIPVLNTVLNGNINFTNSLYYFISVFISCMHLVPIWEHGFIMFRRWRTGGGTILEFE